MRRLAQEEHDASAAYDESVMVGARPGTSLEGDIASLTAGPGTLRPACTAPSAMIESLREQLAAVGVSTFLRFFFRAEEFGFAKIGHPRILHRPHETGPSRFGAGGRSQAARVARRRRIRRGRLAIRILVGAYLLRSGR